MAVGAFVILAILLTFFGSSKKGELENEIAILRSEKEQLSSELEQLRAELKRALDENQYLKDYYHQHQTTEQERNKLALVAKAVHDNVFS